MTAIAQPPLQLTKVGGKTEAKSDDDALSALADHAHFYVDLAARDAERRATISAGTPKGSTTRAQKYPIHARPTMADAVIVRLTAKQFEEHVEIVGCKSERSY